MARTDIPIGLAALQNLWGQQLEAEIRSWVAGERDVDVLHGMMLYQLGYVDETFDPIASSGGKRFRPMLCLLACEAVCGDAERALSAAASIELLHNFSLIHDDIEDRDPSRRHRPTVWKVWGEAQAINAGDAMFAVAGAAVLESSADTQVTLTVSRSFQSTVRQLTDGQFLDMSFETRQDVAPSEYLRMIGLKTGALTAFSAWSGAAIGRAAPSTATGLQEFGFQLGLAFQVRDDIRGIWSASELTGKEVARDVRNRKKTLPALLALEQYQREGDVELGEYFGGSTADADRAVELITATGARNRCEEEVARHLDAALRALRALRLDAGAETAIAELARELTIQ